MQYFIEIHIVFKTLFRVQNTLEHYVHFVYNKSTLFILLQWIVFKCSLNFKPILKALLHYFKTKKKNFLPFPAFVIA